MILQKVRLAKQETADGKFHVKLDVGAELFSKVNTIGWERSRGGGGWSGLCTTIVEPDGTTRLPVELLEFTSDFEIRE